MARIARMFLFLCLLVASGAAVATVQARVAAASSLAFVLPEIVAAFRAQGGGAVEVSYGASGLLARQIQRGAPFELFLSANEAYVATLASTGLTRDAGAVYALGELVLFSATGGGIDPATPLQQLPALHEAGGLRRLALAHPEQWSGGGRVDREITRDAAGGRGARRLRSREGRAACSTAPAHGVAAGRGSDRRGVLRLPARDGGACDPRPPRIRSALIWTGWHSRSPCSWRPRPR
jgi:molybdate transport system substrate-binding protein